MPRKGPVRVVLADDDANVRSALRALLDDSDGIVVVAEAEVAADAVAACTTHEPDVAVIDVRMPGDGLAATREIASSPTPTQVVVLTAHDSPETRAAATASGAARFVVKSDGDDLVQTVRDVAGHARPGMPNRSA